MRWSFALLEKDCTVVSTGAGVVRRPFERAGGSRPG
jgi:hypothetical protein